MIIETTEQKMTWILYDSWGQKGRHHSSIHMYLHKIMS